MRHLRGVIGDQQIGGGEMGVDHGADHRRIPAFKGDLHGPLRPKASGVANSAARGQIGQTRLHFWSHLRHICYQPGNDHREYP